MAWLFRTATGDLLRSSPADDIEQPRRGRAAKRSFDEGELQQVVSIAIAIANNPEVIEFTLRS